MNPIRRRPIPIEIAPHIKAKAEPISGAEYVSPWISLTWVMTLATSRVITATGYNMLVGCGLEV